MYNFRVVMDDSTIVEVSADYAESAEKIAENDTGKMALYAECMD